jgi:sulfur carrier protein
VNVTVNGERTPLAEDVNVAVLVERLTVARRGVAVAVNGEVVPRSVWAATALTDGDRVEVLTAAQGG